MSRSGYCDDEWGWSLICWRRAVAAAIKGKRGQAFLLEMWKAMNALPEKKLIADELEEEGAVCAIGSVGKSRGIDMANLDPEDSDKVAEVFGISTALAREIVWLNDSDGPRGETPEARWSRMKHWIESNLAPI